MSEAALAGMQDALAEIEGENARLLLDPAHDGVEVLALELRAQALRMRISALTRQSSRSEPVEVRRGGGALLVSGG